MPFKIRFIISLFGDRHANMLLPLLASIEQTNPEAVSSIYWEDIHPSLIQKLQASFPRTDWHQTHFNFSTDITKRISSKTLVWALAAQEQKNTGEWLVFLDADTLVIKNILPFLLDQGAEALFAHRKGSFPLNSGVVAFKAGQATENFFTAWQKETAHILETPELFASANDKKLPYGGADQMAIHRLIDYSPEKTDYTQASQRFHLQIKMIACEDFNETYSVPLSERTRIIHYKGGWRSILFEAGPFTKNRPKKDSWEMYLLYIRAFQRALQVINKRLDKHYTLTEFGFTIPFYIDPLTLAERPFLYPFYVLRWQVKNFFPRLSLYLRERLPR